MQQFLLAKDGGVCCPLDPKGQDERFCPGSHLCLTILANSFMNNLLILDIWMVGKFVGTILII
jgi:hypothetical protein